jgi:hypothetical protein
MKRFASICLAAAALFWAVPAMAQDDGPKITIKGFVSATMFVQDQSFLFSNGQAAEWAASDNEEDEWFLGGDVRNTRIQLGITGPTLKEWQTRGLVEMDFFGGFNGTGAFSDEQETPRLRLAYVDLVKGGTTVRIGQAWTPLFGATPTSVTHVAFPLAYGSAGKVGWRFPGVFLIQDLGSGDGEVGIQLQLAAFRGSWGGPGNNLENLSAGEAAMVPQLEARVDLKGDMWGAYVVGHVDQKDLSGVGAEFPDDDDDSLTGTAVEFGGSVRPAPLTLQGNVYWGQAIGQQFGAITQFGDIQSWGAWGQAGFQLDPQWSVWGLYGVDDPDDDDVIASGNARLMNTQIAGMIRYSMSGYSIGVEYLRADTDYWDDDAGAETEFSANQLSLSVLFAF